MNDNDLKIITRLYYFCYEILCFIKNLDFEKFIDATTIRKSCTFNIQQIGEFAKGLSGDFRKKYENINWKQMIGMRNIITHKYDGINYDIVWKTIREDILVLIKFTDKIMKKHIKETDVLTVDFIIKELVPIFKEEGITKATLIGDYADGTANYKSHVEILVEVEPRVIGLEFIGIEVRAKEALWKFVSLVTDSVLDRNPHLMLSKELNGILFYERKED
jgi:uncharacterized protein with HEPN domain/predicted nucleotidyltransferase